MATTPARIEMTPQLRYSASLLGERLKRVRHLRQWSQRDLAKRANMHHGSLCEIERGQRAHLYVDTLVALAVTLGCTTDFLLGLTEQSLPYRQGIRVAPKSTQSAAEPATTRAKKKKVVRKRRAVKNKQGGEGVGGQG